MNRLAIYLRLSIEDKRRNSDGNFIQDESNSIKNQRKLILKYIHQDPDLAKYEVVEFNDDGYSGTNMERPGIKKLLKEIRKNNICCIIVKDMSRFSRDYIEMGTYLNQIFPFMGIRFIALNDHYDSRDHNGNTVEIDTAFQTLLYDLYSKDISLKVKASFENKCVNGEYVFGQVPFGYQKSREVKNTVIVNEKEAKIVRYIFSLAMQEKSSTQIARQLYKENVPTITQIRKQGKEVQDGRFHTWDSQAVRKILNNRFYLGEMAYGKSIRSVVGSKSGKVVPKKDWKIIGGHHEALVSEEIFEQVSRFRAGQSTKRNKEKHPLTGKLYCGGCGYSLSYKSIHGKNKYRRFECRKHALLQILECCTYINADLLQKTVLFMLNKEVMLYGNPIKQKENIVAFQEWDIYMLKKKLEEYKKEKKQVQVKKDDLYERYALMECSVTEYQKEEKKLEELLVSLSLKERETMLRLTEIEHEYQKTKEDIKQMMGDSYIKELTQDVVDTFIKKVYVYKGKKIEIEWNFNRGCMK